MPTVNKTPRHPLVLAIAFGALILALKLLAYFWTDSMALKSDALESIVNLLAASFALLSVIYANLPADENHPYGHGKIEYFSATFEGGLILLAAILIAYESVEKLIQGQQLSNLGPGMLLNFLAGTGNGFLGFYLIRAGKKYRSRSIEADGHHLISDLVTTAGVAAGLIAVYFTGLHWLDPAVAVLFSLWLFYTGARLIKQSIGGLMDQEDPVFLERLIGLMNAERSPEIISIRGMRSMRSGKHVHIDSSVAVPEHHSVAESHRIVRDFQSRVLKKGAIHGEFHTSILPCQRSFCSQCALADCPIREEEFIERPALTMDQVTVPADLPRFPARLV